MSLIFLLLAASTVRANITDFEDLTLGSESYWNGSDSSGGFTSGSSWFNNNYDITFGSWDGFAYSNITDSATEGWAAQYNSITGGGEGGSANYGVAYIGFTENPSITFDTASNISGISVTNNNFAYYSMLNGDSFAKKFGGVSGDDPDWFKLTIEGFDTGDISTGTVDFYLADFRFTNNSLDYIVDTWQSIDLTSLGTVKSIEFSLNSTDVGEFGMNTPAYFAMDTVVPEPATLVLFGLGGLMLRKKEE